MDCCTARLRSPHPGVRRLDDGENLEVAAVRGIALLVCLIVVAAIVRGADARGSAPPPTADSEPPLVIGDTMNMLIAGAASVSDLEAAGIPEPEELNVPKGVYSLIRF